MTHSPETTPETTPRIVVVTTSYPSHEEDPSGHFVRAEVRALERAGHDVRVLAPEVLDGAARSGAFGWPGAVARVRERPWRAIGAARWVARARAELRRFPAERVICHWAVPSAWPIAVPDRGRQSARERSWALDVVSHGGDVRLLNALPAAARRALVQRIAARATTWRFVSESLREELARALDGAARAAVERIARVEAPLLELPEGAALRALHETAARLREEAREARGDCALYVVVARLVASKRVDAAIAFVAERGPGARLVIVGDGPERARLAAIARARRVDVRFEGTLARRDALAWIAAADALIHASKAEGLSTVVREAEALGVHVERL